MGHADQATLLPHGRDRLGRGQAGRHGPLEEEPDQVPRACADLLPDDHGEAVRRGGAGRKGAVEAIVVGDREVGQPALRCRPDDGPRRGERIERRGRVAVEVDERSGRAAGRAGAHVVRGR
jgi:hypothetical protein